MESGVERVGRCKVPTEGLLDDNTRVGGAAGFVEAGSGGAEKARRYGEIEQRPLRGAKHLTQPDECPFVLIIPGYVGEPGGQTREGVSIDTTVRRDAVLRSGTQVF